MGLLDLRVCCSTLGLLVTCNGITKHNISNRTCSIIHLPSDGHDRSHAAAERSLLEHSIASGNGGKFALSLEDTILKILEANWPVTISLQDLCQ